MKKKKNFEKVSLQVNSLECFKIVYDREPWSTVRRLAQLSFSSVVRKHEILSDCLKFVSIGISQKHYKKQHFEMMFSNLKCSSITQVNHLSFVEIKFN